MSNGIKLKVFQAVGSGCSIPYKNPSMFLVSAIYSAIVSTFVFFTSAFYQPGEEPEFLYSITGILSLGEFLFFLLVVGTASILFYSVLSKMAYDSLDGKPDFSEAISLSVRKFLPLFVVYILGLLIVVFGIILLVIPGIFLAVKLSYPTFFILFDNQGVMQSFRSGWQIIKGNWWRTFALLLIWGLISGLIGFVSVYLPRTTETIIHFVLYLLITPWIISAFVQAYTQLKGKTESPTMPVES
ncbi:MAG: hypothetical protein DDT22_01293 [candidate division WS2 bacterium]|nr:hypothetical protein [Candidatus Lithacetigena glycinireducens]